ncbi:hypothetical protein EZS27_015206 [termite gut metagenome]|uniref:Helicase HerA central domain-containing protein n=1 Tax=termite gut metagenome TaxID=433724 RepID=A0A5J4RU98_9ZZZZ
MPEEYIKKKAKATFNWINKHTGAFDGLEEKAHYEKETIPTYLDEIHKSLLPNLIKDNDSILAYTEENTYLGCMYLFPISDIIIPVELEKGEVAKYINNKYQTILSAAYAADICVSTVIKGDVRGIKVYLGCEVSEENKDKKINDYYNSILNGILPHTPHPQENITLDDLIHDFPNGGLVTGIPVLRNEDERHAFNISSVVRSMYGKKFVLLIKSIPIKAQKIYSDLDFMLKIRDICHGLAKATTVKHDDWTKNRTNTGSAILYSQSRSSGHSWGESLTKEDQNGWAVELEKIAENYVKRLSNGLNIGYWETVISFAAEDAIGCDILGGSLIGELSKPCDTLYPPKVYTELIPIPQKGDAPRKLFLPKKQEDNPVFEKPLASYINTSELAFIASPPIETLPGYEIKRALELALSDTPKGGEYKIGKIIDKGLKLGGADISLSQKDINKHIFICGLTGSGKTTTMRKILKEVATENKVPFLVIESAKRDYRQLLVKEPFDKVSIFTIGNSEISPIAFNPFYVQEGACLSSHIDNLKAIFNASFSLYGPMPHILEKCLYRIYKKKGWNLDANSHPNFLNKEGFEDSEAYKIAEHKFCFPTLLDLKEEVDNYIVNELKYAQEQRDNIRSAIVVRLESLCIGSKGKMFNTYECYPIKTLLEKNVIFEMEYLSDDDDKAFFVGLILMLISEYRQRYNPAVNPGKEPHLEHFLVIEEAHRLLKNIETERSSETMGNPKGKAVETFCNVISEMRSLGQGVAVVEQIPTKISPDVIKNSNTKIVHRLVSNDDQEFAAASLCISNDDSRYLSQLITGHALCHKEGMEKPVECVIDNDVELESLSDKKLKEYMTEKNSNLLTTQLPSLKKETKDALFFRFFNTLAHLENYTDSDVVNVFNLLEQEIKLAFVETDYQVNSFQINEFIIQSILDIISSRAIFRTNYKFTKNFKNMLGKFVTERNQSSLDRFFGEMKVVYSLNIDTHSYIKTGFILYIKRTLQKTEDLNVNPEIVERAIKTKISNLLLNSNNTCLVNHIYTSLN